MSEIPIRLSRCDFTATKATQDHEIGGKRTYRTLLFRNGMSSGGTRWLSIHGLHVVPLLSFLQEIVVGRSSGQLRLLERSRLVSGHNMQP